MHFVISSSVWCPGEGCASVPAAADTFGNIVNEAPVATREARVETKPLLLIVLMADMTPPFLAYAHGSIEVDRGFGASNPGGGIKSSELYLGSRDELLPRHRAEGVQVGNYAIPK
jgi:hypothetical protein